MTSARTVDPGRGDRHLLTGAALVLGGATVLLVATFLPWATSITAPASASGWTLARGDYELVYDDAPSLSARPLVIVVLVCAAVFFAVAAVAARSSRSDHLGTTWWSAIVVGWVSVIIGGAYTLLIASLLRDSYAELKFGYSLVVGAGMTALIGMLILTVTGIRRARARRRSSTPPARPAECPT